MNLRRCMCSPQSEDVINAALCITAKLRADVADGSWLCENSSARRARRNISKKLRTMESNRAPRTMLDTLLENCIFYISQLYEFSRRLGQDRLSEECPRRVRFTSTNRHQSPRLSRPVSANCGLMHRSKLSDYSISSSARPDSGSGTVMPSVLAVLRLMTNSTFTTC